MGRVGKPVGPLCHKSPRPNMGNSGGERIDVAIDPINLGQTGGKPLVLDAAMLDQLFVDCADHFGMNMGRNPAIIGNLAEAP